MEDDFLEEMRSILSGKPVAKKAPAVRRSEYDPLFEKYGREYGVDPNLLRAQAQQESGFNPRAKSNKNAQGLMQIIPSTAKDLGVTDVWDPEQNIRGGAKYMRQLLDQFDGDVSKALAGYNAGPGAVMKYKGIPPYKETQDYVKKILANYQGSGTVSAGSDLDINELAGILGGKPSVDIDELKNILSGAEESDTKGKKVLGLPTGTEPTVPEGTRVQAPSPLDLGVPAYKPEEVKTTVTPTPSIPNPEIAPKAEKPNRLAPPPAAPTKQVAKKKAQEPVPEDGFSVSVEPGAYTVVDPSQGVMVDAGVQVDMADRQVGRGTDDLNRRLATVKVDLRGVDGDKGDYAVRRAYESIASQFDLTPEHIEKAVSLRRNAWGANKDRPIAADVEEGTVEITLQDIAKIKGEKETVTDERIKQAQARPILEELPPDELLNQFNPADVELVNRLNESRDAQFKSTDSGNALVDLLDNANKNFTAGVIGSGGRTMDTVAGLYRLANEVFTGRGTRDKILRLSGNEEKIKAFRTDDLELAMREIADIAKRPGAELEKNNGYFGSIVQLAGGMPGDLSRVMFMSATPGGVVAGMSADMALQSAGRGETIDKVGMEAFKGALFGGIARLAGPIGEKWATNLADLGAKPLASKLGGGAASVGFTAAGTYPVSRAFGADPKTALKETLFNTVFGMADTLPALKANTGRTVRVSDTEGNSLTVHIDRHGDIKEVTLPKDQPADLEIMDPTLAAKREEYVKVAESATDMLNVERSRSFVDRLREAEFTRDGDSVAMNPQATTILHNILEYTTRNSSRPFSAADDGFRGITVDKDIAGSLVRGIERMRDDALADGDTVQGIELNDFLIKFEDSLKAGNNEGGFYTKFEEPEYEKLSLADRDEELLHLQGIRSGLENLLENGLPNSPTIDKIRKHLGAKYQERGAKYQYNEVIAQIFRRDSDAHLGISKQEARQARQEMFRALEQVEDFDHEAFAGALNGINRTGKAYARYHKQVSGRGDAQQSRPADEPARTEASEPTLRSVQDTWAGSLGDSGRPDGRNVPEEFRDRRDLVPEPVAAEVAQPGLEVPIARPERETLQPWAPTAVPDSKPAPEIGDFVTIGPGGKPYMVRDITPDGMARLDDAMNPFENALIDVPVRELDIYQKVVEKDDTPSVIDEVAVRDAAADERLQHLMDEGKVADAVDASKFAAPEKKPEPAADPAAVERGSIEPDGRVWFRGKIVEPSNEVTSSLLGSIKESVDSVTQRLDKLRRAPVDADGRVTDQAFLNDVFALDHREYGKSKVQLIADAERELARKQQEITDITNANSAWKKQQPAAVEPAPSRPTPEQAAVDQMVAESVPEPKGKYNFINTERQSYLLGIVNSKNAKITTAKIGGKDVTFLDNKKSKVMLQPEEVPFVEERLADKNIDPQMASGVDADRIFFASEFKKQKIFDKAKQDEILEFSNEHFPYLASLWRRPAGSGSPIPGLNQAAKERRQAARGLDEMTLPQRVAASVVKIYHQFTRQFEAINPNESVQMAKVGDAFRLLSNLNQAAKTQAMNDVARVTHGMSRDQLDVFEDVLILRDQQQAGEQGKPLNFGYKDLKEVEADLKVAESAAAADPVISKALAEREKLRVETVRGLVKIGMLGEPALKNTRYYHRIVPQGDDGNMFLSVGSRDIRVRKKGFQKEMKGSITDPNTNYIESEVEWLSQAHAQIRKTQLLDEVKHAIDISGDLKAQAKLQGIDDWTDLIPKTHRIWQPQEGSYFYEVMTVPDQLITDIFAGRHNVKSATAEMKKAFAAGQRKPEWVLPVEVANLMDDFQLQLPEGEVANIASKANASWKQWQLINPKNVVSYNLRNMISDLDVAMAYPGILTEMPGALQDIVKYTRDKKSPAAKEIEQAIWDGVMDSGITFAEIPDINKTGVFKKFADSDTNAISKAVRSAWDISKNTTNARENWIRLAAYRYMKKQLASGRTIYGASTPEQVNALSANRQAAKLARELVGDYGGISSAGRTIRKHMIPFYSWLEINAPRYLRLLRNVPFEAEANANGSGRSTLGTFGATAARSALGGAAMGGKMLLITAAINVWNHTMYSEVEEKLMKTDVGRRPHFIVGVNDDGTARVFQADTALRDALDWINVGDTVADIADLASGRSTVQDKLAEAVKAPINKVVQGLGPQYKLPYEILTAESSFPSIFEKGSSFNLQTRPIRDRWEHLAQTFAVKGLYQRITGRPQPPSTGPVGTGLDWFVTNRIDPAESIFWNVRSKVSDYKKKMGKSNPGGDFDEKSNTLFYYKQAIKWNDQLAAERYLKQYKEEFGGDEASLKQSITKTHPLGGMAKADWPEFVKTLRPEELDQLKIAIEYYNNKFMYPEKGTPAEGTTTDDVMQMLFPGKTAEDIETMVEAERRKDAAGALKKAIMVERLANP